MAEILKTLGPAGLNAENVQKIFEQWQHAVDIVIKIANMFSIEDYKGFNKNLLYVALDIIFKDKKRYAQVKIEAVKFVVDYLNEENVENLKLEIWRCFKLIVADNPEAPGWLYLQEQVFKPLELDILKRKTSALSQLGLVIQTLIKCETDEQGKEKADQFIELLQKLLKTDDLSLNANDITLIKEFCDEMLEKEWFGMLEIDVLKDLTKDIQTLRENPIIFVAGVIKGLEDSLVIDGTLTSHAFDELQKCIQLMIVKDSAASVDFNPEVEAKKFIATLRAKLETNNKELDIEHVKLIRLFQKELEKNPLKLKVDVLEGVLAALKNPEDFSYQNFPTAEKFFSFSLERKKSDPTSSFAAISSNLQTIPIKRTAAQDITRSGAQLDQKRASVDPRSYSSAGQRQADMQQALQLLRRPLDSILKPADVDKMISILEKQLTTQSDMKAVAKRSLALSRELQKAFADVYHVESSNFLKCIARLFEIQFFEIPCDDLQLSDLIKLGETAPTDPAGIMLESIRAERFRIAATAASTQAYSASSSSHVLFSASSASSSSSRGAAQEIETRPVDSSAPAPSGDRS